MSVLLIRSLPVKHTQTHTHTHSRAHGFQLRFPQGQRAKARLHKEALSVKLIK